MGRRGAAATAVVATLLVAACSGPARSGGDAAPSPTEEAAPGLGAFSVADMLAEIPASVRKPGETFTLYTGDITRASDLSGFTRPDDAGSEEAGQWVSKLGGVGPTGPFPAFVPLEVPLSDSPPPGLVADELGWSVLDVERYVSYTSSELTTTVAAGAFDEDTLDHLPRIGSGIRSAGEGADLSSGLEDSSPTRPQGIPLRLAVDAGRVVVSPFTSVVEEWLAGPRDSLAEDPLLSGMADLLDREGVYAAMFATSKPMSRRMPPVLFTLLDFTRDDLPTFDAVAIAWGFGEGEPEMTVVYHVPDSVDVRDTTAKVAARWAGTDFRGTDLATYFDVGHIRTVGDHVVVSLTTAGDYGADVVFLMQDQGDLPFVTP